jgi:hypothetical protein
MASRLFIREHVSTMPSMSLKRMIISSAAATVVVEDSNNA